MTQATLEVPTEQITADDQILSDIHSAFGTCSHLKGHAKEISATFDGKTIVLSGGLPYFFYKQIAQEKAKKVVGLVGISIQNDIEVSAQPNWYEGI